MMFDRFFTHRSRWILLTLCFCLIGLPLFNTASHAAEEHKVFIPLVVRPGARYYDDLDYRANRQFVASIWQRQHLTYFFQHPTPDLSVAIQRQAIRTAFQMWADVTPLTFSEATSATTADIVILWATGVHGDNLPFDGTWNVLAHAYYPQDGDIHFDDDEVWLDTIPTSSSGVDLVSVAAHEIGHSLGLEHSEDVNALMYPIYLTTHRFLHSDDIGRIQTLYGSRTPNIPISAVQINGPVGGLQDVTYTFNTQAVPENATGPMVYHWSPEPQTGQGTARADYRWAVPGNHTIRVTATNPGGTQSAIKVVTIQPQTWLIDYAANGFGWWNVTLGQRGGSDVEPVPADYDGDGKADISIKVPDGRWLIDYAANGFNYWETELTQRGGSDVEPVPADYDGDGKADISIKVPDGRWLIDYAANGFNYWETELTQRGGSDVEPVPADYDGDGKADISIKVPDGRWLIDYAANGFNYWETELTQRGGSDVEPVPADYDGDGKADISIKVPDGRWLIDYAANGFNYWEIEYREYGDSTVVPVPADYDGDGKADLSVKTADGRWLIDYARDGFGWWNIRYENYGGNTAVPVPADYDGDTKADLSVKNN